jgi:ABC-type transport system involved in cytochrome c biogenesis ATPase subunit
VPPLGRLQSYAVKGLFGRADHHFDFDPHEPTLLTGVNGTGKSTILKTIDAISAGRWSSLAQLPFDRLMLTFEGDVIEVVRDAEDSQLVITVDGLSPWTYTEDRRLKHLIGRLRAYPAWDLSVEDLRRLSGLELARATAHLSPPDTAALFAFLDEEQVNSPDWVSELRGRFPVLFVTDQRLVLDSPRREVERRAPERVSTVAVDEAAREIAREIQRAKSTYATVSQRLDRDFPQRVVRAMQPGDRAPGMLLGSRLAELTKVREGLELAGLLAKEEASAPFTELELRDPNIRAVVETYLTDTQEKLATLEPLRRRLQLFTDFLNQHYRNQHYGSKRVVIDQETGFRIEMDGAAEPLRPNRLSSGEQQILVLAHEILFRAKPKTLVLIDEPELSLHVLWQATFVDDLTRMGEVDDLSFLLATHSPTLIGAREDLKRSLDA